jgi:predicted metal-dependent hydrolase
VSKTRRAVVVTVPSGCRIEEAGRFLKTHVDWVRERLGRVPEPVTLVTRLRLDAALYDPAPARQPGTRGAPRKKGDRQPSLAQRLVDPVTRWEAVMVRWYGGEMRLVELASGIARWYHPGAPVITLRDQTTRWGSCSASGLLSFSWRLIRHPPACSTVAAHEVAHLREMNHGPASEAGCRRRAPPEEAKHWLRHEGTDLHRYAA